MQMMTTEEKLITMQTLAKILETNRAVVKVGLDGVVSGQAYPISIMDTADRLKIQAKIVELVESIDPKNSTTIARKEFTNGAIQS